jgi:hypothetical protein
MTVMTRCHLLLLRSPRAVPLVRLQVGDRPGQVHSCVHVHVTGAVMLGTPASNTQLDPHPVSCVQGAPATIYGIISLMQW